MKIRVHLQNVEMGSVYEIYIVQDLDDGSMKSLTAHNGNPQWKSRPANSGESLPPFLRINGLLADVLFKALANGLAENGIYPDTPNEDKIKAEALLEREMKETDRQRSLIENILITQGLIDLDLQQILGLTLVEKMDLNVTKQFVNKPEDE